MTLRESWQEQIGAQAHSFKMWALSIHLLNTHKHFIKSIEAVLNRAAHFIAHECNRLSRITKIKHSLSLLHLQTCRDIALICLLHKTIQSNRQTTLPLTKPHRSSSSLNNSMCFQRLSGQTHTYNNSALPRGIKMWNRLPDTTVNKREYTTFRNKLTLLFSSQISPYKCFIKKVHCLTAVVHVVVTIEHSIHSDCIFVQNIFLNCGYFAHIYVYIVMTFAYFAVLCSMPIIVFFKHLYFFSFVTLNQPYVVQFSSYFLLLS